MADTTDDVPAEERKAEDATRLALAVIWCADRSRVGEVILLEDEECFFGRGGAGDDAPGARAVMVRQRPGRNEARDPLAISSLSRVQLGLSLVDGGVRVRNLGRRELLFDKRAVEGSPEVIVGASETFEVKGQIAFAVVERPKLMKRPRSSLTATAFDFGEPDASGFVGESPVAWAIRDQIAFIAARAAHVLVLGQSGTGKEVVAQSIHGLSKRSGRTMVSRSAATIPSGIADAELFGNLANYPNPGTPERRGLVGEADGSTLFLDEIGELPQELQAKLLRVLDERGEYQRLGEARTRRSDLRLVGATNRPVAALKHDVSARFRLRLTLVGLDARPEDIPLIARHLVLRVARSDQEIGERFLEGWDGRRGEPRLSAGLVRALVTHRYQTHVRELEAILWQSIATSEGESLDLTADVESSLSDGAPTPSSRRSVDITEEEVRRVLERVGGVQDRAWRELGLANRFVLHRLMKKMGIHGT